MVLKHNKRYITDDETCQHISKCARVVDFGQPIAVAEISSYSSMSKGHPVSDHKDFLGVQVEAGAGENNNHAFSVVDEHKSKEGSILLNERFRTTIYAVLSNHSANSTDVAAKPARNYSPIFEDNVCRPASKLFPVQGGQTCEQNLLPELHLTGSKFGELHTSVATSMKSDEHKCYASFEESMASVDINKHSDFPLVRCSEDGKAKLDSSFQSLSVPYCFEDVHLEENFNQVDELYIPNFPYCHCKPVAIGPNHQAEIPPWRPHNYSSPLKESIYSEGSASHSSSCSVPVDPKNGEDSSERFVGTPVLPILDTEFSASEFRLLGRVCCRCEDEGSIRCVRQHVKEAREGLKHELGEDIYRELGFLDMGEDVAWKWSEEEEHMFFEVVFSNAASLGRNFWDYLPQFLPYRNGKDLVSYYFNVFMLRKRAKQNRVEPLHVDSDDDEWQERNGAESEEEYDSDVESFDHTDSVFNANNQMTDTNQGSDKAEAPKDCTADGANKDYTCYLSEECRNGLGKNVKYYVEDQDNQDDSCTTDEANHHGVEACGCPDMLDTQYCVDRGHKFVCGEYKNVGADDNGFDGNCDLRIWDAIAGYVYRHNKDMEFSATCDVIEVFGKEILEEGQL